MAEFNFRFLGTYQVSAAATPVTDFHSDKARALLAYLVIEPREHARSTLAALLWPEIGDQYARTNLRNTLYRLRQALDVVVPGSGDSLLMVSRQSICFKPEHATVDVHDFLTAVHKAQAAASAVDLDQLAAAVAHYRGELLAGFGVADAPAFEEWLLLRREMLHQQALVAMHTLTTAYETAGSYDRAHAVTGRLLALDPLREETHRQIMRLLARMGQPDRALTQLERLRQLLHQEMGVDPADETLTLARQIAAGAFGKAQEPVLSLSKDDKRTGRQEDKVTVGQESVLLSSSLDLSEVPLPGAFFGRGQERAQIAQWLVKERCRVVAILGIGGMGKTTLAAQCVRELASQDNAPFEALYWRSLVNAPPLGELLPPLLQALSQQQLTQIPEQVDEQLRLLLGYLRERRVLLVLDNMESILEQGAVGVFRAGYEPYGQLLQRMATLEHRSQLMLTSRELPRSYGRLERDGYPVKSLQLAGLDNEASHQLFRQRGVLGDDDQKTALVARYSGNPLALKLVADTIDEVFSGDMAEFLADDTLIFDDIRTVLDQHFARLSRLEQDILFWLAIEREQVDLQFLHTNLLQAPPRRALLEALNSLRRRTLIEGRADGLSLQNVITEYLSERLIEIIVHEICSGTLDRLHTHPLIIAQAKQYIRQSQERLLLQPVAARVAIQLRTGGLEHQMHSLLATMRTDNSHRQSYAGGTILNILLYLGVDLSGFDFSQIPIRQAYLQGYEVHGANFSNARFEQIVFTNTFGAMLTLAIHPDGDILATGTADGDVQLWQVADGQLAMQIRGHTDSVMSVAFSPDGQTLASASRDRLIHLWDTQTGQLRQSLRGHTKPLRSIVFSPYDQTLISAGEDSEIHLWDIASGTLRRQLSAHVHVVCAIALSPDGQTLASGGEDNILRLWDMQTGQLLHALHGHAELINALCFSPDGQTLASAGGDQSIHLWDVKSGRELDRLMGHGGRIRTLAYSPDGKLLASGGEDTTIRLWHMEDQAIEGNRRIYRTLNEHNDWVVSLKFSLDGQRLISSGHGRSLRFWDMDTGQVLSTFHGYANWISSVVFSPDQSTLVSGSFDQTVRVWDLTTHKVRHTFWGGHMGRVVVDISPDGRLIAIGSDSSVIHVHDAHSGETYFTLHVHTDAIRVVTFSPDGRILASGSADETICLWDVETGDCLQQLHGHTGAVRALAYSPDGRILASGSQDNTVRLWEIINGKAIDSATHGRMLSGHTGWLNAIAFSPNGQILASDSTDLTIRLWNVASGKVQDVLDAPTAWGGSLAFSPNGNLLAYGGHDQTVRLWDVEAGIEHAALHGHRGLVYALSFSPDSQLLASGASDETIRLWDMGKPLESHAVHTLLRPPGPYEGMNISGATGISEAQRAALKALGAVEAY